MNADGAQKDEIMWVGLGKPKDIDPTAVEALSRLDYETIYSLLPKDYLYYLKTITSSPRAQEILSQNIDVIAALFEMDTKLANVSNDWAYTASMVMVQTERAFGILKNQTVSPEIIDHLTKYILSDEYQLPSKGMLGILDRIDQNNQKQGKKFVNVHQQYHDVILKGLINPDKIDEQAEYSIIYGWPFLTGIRELLIDALMHAPTDDVIRRIYPLFANRFDLEPMRQFLREYADHHKDFEPHLSHIENVLGFDKAPSVPSLDSTYKAIEESFLRYKPNEELLPAETKILKKSFKPGENILDVGCGPGARHMNALKDSGIQIKGIDITSSNVKRAKQDNPALDISVADWHALPYDNSSFDGVYCFGRSMLHNTTLDDWLQTLREMRRVLKPTEYYPPAETKLLIDIPKLSSGNYGKESNKFSEKARALGIYQHETGSIHDSPDNEHFLDRFVPTVKQFRIMAEICGFDAKIIAKKPYGTEGDINLYWKLTPFGSPWLYQRYMSKYGRELTNAPIVTFDMSRKGY